MTTRFPQLPVMGHVPKKRAKPVLPPLELEEIFAALDRDRWLYWEIEDVNSDYIIQKIKDELTDAAKSKKRKVAALRSKVVGQ